MADFAFNIAKGRVVELANRVKLGDPAAARLYWIPIDAGAITDATIKDLDDFAAVITAGVTERSTNNWNRKTVAAADIAAIAPNDASDAFTVDIVTDPSWSPGPSAAGGNSTDLILCYASVATPTNAQLLPMLQFDWPMTADGADLLATVNTAGFFQAT